MNVHLPPARTPNQAALRRLRSTIDSSYPKGRFVAIGDDHILGDAATFEDLESMLRALGRKPGESLVVRAGMKLPDYVIIFL